MAIVRANSSWRQQRRVKIKQQNSNVNLKDYVKLIFFTYVCRY